MKEQEEKERADPDTNAGEHGIPNTRGASGLVPGSAEPQRQQIEQDGQSGIVVGRLDAGPGDYVVIVAGALAAEPGLRAYRQLSHPANRHRPASPEPL